MLFTKRADYDLVLNYILRVCSVAVQHSDAITPIALAGQFDGESISELVVFDLRQAQQNSRSSTANFVKELASGGKYAFVAFVSSATIQVQDETSLTACPAESNPEKEAVVTHIYSNDCQVFGHHFVDKEALQIIRGDLDFVSKQSQFNSQFALPVPTQN